MIDYQKELNAEQYTVVMQGDGPCLVLAGAGSGKTRTITYRVAKLLENGIAPDRILLVTFTNKAAREMIGRVQMIVNRDLRLPWSGTFHHVGYKILRKYAPLLGYKNNFTILDSEDSTNLMKLCLKQEGVDRKERRFPSAAVIHSIVSYARNAETTIEDVLDRKYQKWLDIADTIGRIASDYEKRKREANAMDFDDLLVNTYLLLLKSESVRRSLSEQFEYILVDEYQDTNHIQASIIRTLGSKHKNILVVGDDAQSIYSFRAADIQNILSFEREYSEAKVFRLETNYRSTPDILNVANDVIANNRSQYKKELKSMRQPFVRPVVKTFADSEEEAGFVAERILELRDEGVPLNRMAVLFRAAFHSQSLEMELVKRDIPYEYRGGVRFFERAHIKDVLAFVRLYNNVLDAIAWSRVLNLQVGIGPAGAERIVYGVKQLAERSEGKITEDQLQHLGAELSSRGQIGWNDFMQIWHNLDRADNKTPVELIEAVINSKYADYLESEYPDYRERLEDLKQLAKFAEREQNVEQFLADASLQESYSFTQAKNEVSQDEEKIVLSTIHQAKGLEWDTVFILNLANGQFPIERSVREDNGVEEERRLFYVAITRAERLLYMSYPLVGGINSFLSGPSPFLEELNRDFIDEDGGHDNTFHDPSDAGDGIVYVREDEEQNQPGNIFRKSKPGNFLRDIEDLPF